MTDAQHGLGESIVDGGWDNCETIIPLLYNVLRCGNVTRCQYSTGASVCIKRPESPPCLEHDPGCFRVGIAKVSVFSPFLNSKIFTGKRGSSLAMPSPVAHPARAPAYRARSLVLLFGVVHADLTTQHHRRRLDRELLVLNPVA